MSGATPTRIRPRRVAIVVHASVPADPRIRRQSDALLASGYEVDIVPRLGTGVDRTLIRSVLRMPVEERLRSLTQEAKFVRTLQKAARGLR